MMEAGEMDAAVRFAAKFPRLDGEKEAITRAAAALNNPNFYEQIGKDPKALVAEGRAALLRRYPSK
jgi:hypothetical protein